MEKTKVILLVDDDLQVRRSISETMHRDGYKVVSASSGADAIAAFNHYRREIGVLVADLKLSAGMSGVELAEQLVRAQPELRVVLMSGSARYSLAFDGAPHFIRKPFAPEQLIERVNKVLALEPGLPFQRDGRSVEDLVSKHYPNVEVHCAEYGNQYLMQLRIRGQKRWREVQFTVTEFADGSWEEKIAAALDQLSSG